jgi:hypothetical protein
MTVFNRGWRYEGARHALAAKGIATKYRQKFPELVKRFIGESPRITEKYARFRQQSPDDFKKSTFRTVDGDDRKFIVGQTKYGDDGVQSVLIKRSRFFAKKDSFPDIETEYGVAKYAFDWELVPGKVMHMYNMPTKEGSMTTVSVDTVRKHEKKSIDEYLARRTL